MSWKDCADSQEIIERGARFKWPPKELGFDCNEAFTINDIFGPLGWVWTWPGDYLLSRPALQSFFENSEQTVIGSNWSTVIGWILGLILLPISIAILVGLGAMIAQGVKDIGEGLSAMGKGLRFVLSIVWIPIWRLLRGIGRVLLMDKTLAYSDRMLGPAFGGFIWFLAHVAVIGA